MLLIGIEAIQRWVATWPRTTDMHKIRHILNDINVFLNFAASCRINHAKMMSFKQIHSLPITVSVTTPPSNLNHLDEGGGGRTLKNIDICHVFLYYFVHISEIMTRMKIIFFGEWGLKVFSCPINSLWSKARAL